MEAKDLISIAGEVTGLVNGARSLRNDLNEMLVNADHVMTILGKNQGTTQFEELIASIRDRNERDPLSNAEMDAIMQCLGPVDVKLDPGVLYVDALASAIVTEQDSPRKRLLMDELAVASTKYVREKVWSTSLLNRIIPMERATPDMLCCDGTEDLKIWWEKEPDSPGAWCVPLNTRSEPEYMKGSRYKIPIARLITEEVSIDAAEVMGGKKFSSSLDRLSTKFVKALDLKFLEMANDISFDADGPSHIDTSSSGDVIVNPNHITGKCQWMLLDDKPDSFLEATRMLPHGNKSGRFVVRNNKVAMSRETHDNLSIGKTADEVFKENVVLFDDDKAWKEHGDRFGYVYFFAEPVFLGKFFTVGDISVYSKSEAFFLTSFAHFLGGFAIGNVGAVAVADFLKDRSHA